MAPIWKLFTGSGRRPDESPPGGQTTYKSQRVKEGPRHRRSLSSLFTSSSARKRDRETATITCEERQHYPLYDPCDPRHNTEILCGKNDKGLWASYGRSIRARLHGSLRSVNKAPNSQSKTRRSMRSSFVSLTGSSRLVRRLSKAENPSKSHMRSIWEPQNQCPNAIDIESKQPSDETDDFQLPYTTEAQSPPPVYLLPSLASISSGLMSPLELDSCPFNEYTEHEPSNSQAPSARLPPISNQSLQPSHILRHVVSSAPVKRAVSQGRPGNTDINSSSVSLGAPNPPSTLNDTACADRIAIQCTPPLSSTPKQSNLDCQENIAPYKTKSAGMSVSSGRRIFSQSSALSNQKAMELNTIVADSKECSTTGSYLHLGDEWLETRKDGLHETSPGISQISTATDSEFGAELHRTSARHQYAATPEGDAALNSWLSSVTSVSHNRENTDFSGSTLCRSPRHSTTEPLSQQTTLLQDRHPNRGSLRPDIRCHGEFAFSNEEGSDGYGSAFPESSSSQLRRALGNMRHENSSHTISANSLLPGISKLFEPPQPQLSPRCPSDSLSATSLLPEISRMFGTPEPRDSSQDSPDPVSPTSLLPELSRLFSVSGSQLSLQESSKPVSATSLLPEVSKLFETSGSQLDLEKSCSATSLLPEVGRLFGMSESQTSLHRDQGYGIGQKSLRDQLCENSPESEASITAFWPDSIDSCIKNVDPVKVEQVRLSKNAQGQGKAEFTANQNSLVPHVETSRTQNHSGSAKPRDFSFDKVDRIAASSRKASRISYEPAENRVLASVERSGNYATSGRDSKASSNRKDASSSGSGSDGSGQSDPLSTTTAGTSIFDFPSDQGMVSKAKYERPPPIPEGAIVKTSENGDEARVKIDGDIMN
ncbi:hypothetical protein AJ79_01594 [Helicocarpus griseus UAMH5409]|uniref:Uncharacterized protein n=1 Tax=Helicocarpus griseus UAMH5409 TaxID=1447875 RepID=A0A2B7Y6R1_9EURO|nr:hypothetical protein AJ79_01594 [Helicocarpus griseus UAMH5409]